MPKVEKSIGKVLKLDMDNEVEKQLPCVIILTTDGHGKNVGRLVNLLFKVLSPSPLGHSLGKALAYINVFFSVLTTSICHRHVTEEGKD